MFSSFKSLLRINFRKIQLAHQNFYVDAFEIVNPGFPNSDFLHRLSKALTKKSLGESREGRLKKIF